MLCALWRSVFDAEEAYPMDTMRRSSTNYWTRFLCRPESAARIGTQTLARASPLARRACVQYVARISALQIAARVVRRRAEAVQQLGGREQCRISTHCAFM